MNLTKKCKAMPKEWKKQERLEHGVTPCSKAWLAKEKREPWHKSLQGKKVNVGKWANEEKREVSHEL